jgi:SPP1 gp7 family putative phage head morphogenesis protein
MVKKKTFNNPDSQEREYTRLLVRYSKQLQVDVERVLIPRLADIKLQFDVERRADSWVDTLDTLIAELARLALEAVGVVIQKLPGQFNAVSKFNEGQFKMVVKANTGLDLPPVMPGAPSSAILGVNVFRSEPFLKPLAEGWISENTALIKSLPTRLHPELEGIIRRGVMNGQSVKDIKDQIKSRYGVTDYRAKLIAQDQTLKLNADLTRYRLQSVGVERYIWRSVQDSRVRPEHAARNGNEYSWKEGAGGEHPGQPVRCRCRAEAVWGDENEPVQSQAVKPFDVVSDIQNMTGFNRLLTREVEGGGTVKNIIPLINNDDLEARFEIFARGANKLELPRVLLDPTKLVTFQDSLSRDKLLSLAKGIAPVRVRELPLIIEDNGKLFIWDGNHRAAISKLKGEKLEALLLTV